MNITLSPELKRFVEAKIGNGRYATAGDVVREAVRLMEARGAGPASERLAGGGDRAGVAGQPRPARWRH
jgi:putative addiction module CopG family antidote